jgi:site-specific DNA recombinase
VFEPEAAIVRRIFDDSAVGGHSLREIIRRLAADAVPPPTGRGRLWSTSTLSKLLRNEAYIGRVCFNRTEAVPDPRPGRRSKQVPRPREDWIAIAVPAIVDEQTFEAAGRVSRDNSQWSPRRTEPGQWLLRGLVKCGVCGVGTNCHNRRGRNGTWNRYYHCRNHDPIKAGGDDRRCPERNIRSDALDTFVFDQVRAALLRPDVLTAGEQALAVRTPPPTTNCSPPNWPAWTASSTPPRPNAAASSTSTRPGCSSYPSCNAVPPRSSTAAATWSNAATPSLHNARS